MRTDASARGLNFPPARRIGQSWGDLELRVAVFKVNGAESNGPQYGWQRIGNEEEELEVWAAWVSRVESRAPEVEKFLGECWETVEQWPNTPLRAAFR